MKYSNVVIFLIKSDRKATEDPFQFYQLFERIILSQQLTFFVGITFFTVNNMDLWISDAGVVLLKDIYDAWERS